MKWLPSAGPACMTASEPEGEDFCVSLIRRKRSFPAEQVACKPDIEAYRGIGSISTSGPWWRARLQTDDLPNYRFTAETPRYRDTPQKVEMAYVIEDRGISVTRGRSVSLIPWKSIRFLHLHVTSGVGTTGFPVYSARLRTLFGAREISSLDWRGEAVVDRSADYVRFMEQLIPIAAARNPRLRLRYGGDPMLEKAIPAVLSIFVTPLVFILFMVVKLPLGVLAISVKKPLGKLVALLFTTGFGAALNTLPWSSGKPFEAHDLPTAELPLRYREGATYESHVGFDQG